MQLGFHADGSTNEKLVELRSDSEKLINLINQRIPNETIIKHSLCEERFEESALKTRSRSCRGVLHWTVTRVGGLIKNL